MQIRASGWTPIVEKQTGKSVSEKLTSAFGNIDEDLNTINEAVEFNKAQLNAYGVNTPNELPLLRLSVDKTKFTIGDFTYYLNKELYTHEETLVPITFTKPLQTVYIAINGTGLINFNYDTPFTEEQTKTLLQLGVVFSIDGTNVTSVNDNYFRYDSRNVDVYQRFKEFEGVRFYQNALKVSKSSTAFHLNVEGGLVSTATLRNETIESSDSISAYTITDGIVGVAISPLVVPNTADENKYMVHTLLRSMVTGDYFLEISKEQINTLQEAINSEPLNTLFTTIGSEVVALAKVIMQGGVDEIVKVIDIRNGDRVQEFLPKEYPEVSLSSSYSETLVVPALTETTIPFTSPITFESEDYYKVDIQVCITSTVPTLVGINKFINNTKEGVSSIFSFGENETKTISMSVGKHFNVGDSLRFEITSNEQITLNPLSFAEVPTTYIEITKG